jgi:hypothetical protein
LSLAVREEGLLLDGRALLLGEAANVTYEGVPEDPDQLGVDGSFRAENLGAWDQANLTAGGP